MQLVGDELSVSLASAAARAADMQRFIRDAGPLLSRTELAVDRVFASVQTLHPAFRARSYLWTNRADEVRVVEWPHGLKNRPGYYDSPDHRVHSSRAEFRMKDFPEASAHSCDLYAKLKAEGFTDYLMVPLPFSDGAINTFSIATRLAGGFPEHALTDFRRLEDMLTVILERFAALETVGTTLSTYLGRDAGRQVMRGRIRAGHGELVEAAILLADLHDFTTHTTRLGPTETVRLLNDYFDCLVGPIEQRGGYVLKFIGDAVLAFFPVSLPGLPPPQPLQAVAGARRRLVELNRARQARGEAALAHSVCLHFGEVLYGNVGSSERLDFTIVGGAVNVTARCLERAQTLGADYLATGEFVARFPNTAVKPLGTYRLRGIAKPVTLMALASTEEGEPTSEVPEPP